MNTRIIIIDGMTAGISAVSEITGGSRAEVVVYKEGTVCSRGIYGLPYYLVNREADIRQAVVAIEETLRTPDVTAHCRHEVLSVVCDRKRVTVRSLDNGQVLDNHYNRLAMTASFHNPIPDMPGVERVGVQVLGIVEDVIFLKEFTETPFVHDITTIGDSFAGLELAEAFLKMGRSMRIIEEEDQLLPTFDKEVPTMIQRELEESGMKIYLRETLRGLIGDTFIERTEISRRNYDMDLTTMTVEVVPSTGYLVGSGISMTPQREVIISKSMETNIPDICAVGDYTRLLKDFLRTPSLEMADLGVTRIGLTEQKTKKQGSMGSRMRTTLVTANDRPKLCPNTSQIAVKMICGGIGGRALGAQAWEKKNIIARTDAFAVTIEPGITPEQLGSADFSCSSTASSIQDPVQMIYHGTKQAEGNHVERIDTISLSSFGKGAIRQLPAELKRVGIRRALVIIDRFPYETGVTERVGRVLLGGSTEYAIYCQIQPNPTIQVIDGYLVAARTLEAGILVTMGSGSIIDTAKVISVVTANGGSVGDYEGAGKSVRPGIPIVTINVTTDIGSEMTNFYIVTDTRKHSGIAMMDTNCVVWIAINDIGFIMGMPSKLTAFTGVGVLTHTLEVVPSVRATPFTDKYAPWAIEATCEDSSKAVSDDGDEEARTMTVYAEYATGMTFSNAGLGMVHAMVHTLRGRYSLPRGVYNAVLLPCVLEYSGAAPETRIRFEKIAKAMGLEAATGRTATTCGSSPDAQTVSIVIEAARQLSRQMGIPQSSSLPEPVKTENFHTLTELAMKDAHMADDAVRPTPQGVI